ncbi:TIGR03885 family FMN-dependent LLM class oxidoreductase [Cellulomonas sp. 179-A 9B4 NHS]|uniref:TIGR03885 family FMN-dependent LLM class oxidoreductase n=1 Tax=Cellulomonas sp. 179-A 9B4 NHS TaxID=3142379 RepID=UPI0039A23C5F
MVRVGLHNSHEQVHPSALLAATQQAEQRGFDAAMCSDHWAPWSAGQGHSGFAWTWLGSALASTRLPFGVVNAPGQRYHPAIIAQAAATLSAMYPGRFWVALGSGQNMNEHVTGDPWPEKDVRDARLVECVEIIRALLDGEEVTHDGLVTVDRAKLWTLPDVKPLLIGPAVSPETAARHARWADGLVTVNQPPEKLRAIVDAYRSAGGRGEISLQVHVSYAPTADEAFELARSQWAGNAVGPPLAWDIATPEEFDAAAKDLPDEKIHEAVVVDHEPARMAERVAELAEIGFDAVYLHQVATDVVVSDEKHPHATATVTPAPSSLEAFVDLAAEHLLPVLKQVRA